MRIAESVKSGSVTAVAHTLAALDRIQQSDGSLNCFTEVLAERAIEEAQAIDAAVARGEDPGPLAGVPFAVKNLLDISGIPTLAGSKIRANSRPPDEDAAAIAALRRAGAVLGGALNMDEFAYGFTTENSHYGPTRNP